MIAVQPDLTGHKSEPVRSFRVPECCRAWVRQFEDSGYCNVWQKRTLPRIKRRESREPMALWRSLGRPQCGFHISAPAFSPRYHIEEQTISKGTPTQHGVPFRIYAAPIVPRRDRHKETHKPEVNPISTITSVPFENVLRRSRPARNRNAACRKPSCLARMRQTAGVRRTQNVATGLLYPNKHTVKSSDTIDRNILL